MIIHNTESIQDINKDYNVDIGLPGDARLTIEMLIEEVKAQSGEQGRRGQTTVAAEIAEIRRQWMAQWSDVLKSDEKPINTYRVIGEIERVLDHEHSIVTHDAGAPPGHDHAVLHGHGAAQLRGLGEVHAPRLRHSAHDRREAGEPAQVLPELHG